MNYLENQSLKKPLLMVLESLTLIEPINLNLNLFVIIFYINSLHNNLKFLELIWDNNLLQTLMMYLLAN